MQIAEKKKLTDEDYLLLAEGTSFQLIKYDFISFPPSTPLHQAIILRLCQIILDFLDKNDGNDYLGSDVGVRFDDGNVFRPDIVFISEARKNEILTDRIISGIPDMLIEILSLETAYYDLLYKKNICEKFGVREYIIIDTIAEVAELYSLENNTYRFQKIQKTETLNSVLLPGLIFDLKKIFK